MNKVKVTQIKSSIGRPKKQKDTIVALGLGKINRSVTHNMTESINGMLKKINHLVSIEEINS